jgi:hypothetical protein
MVTGMGLNSIVNRELTVAIYNYNNYFSFSKYMYSLLHLSTTFAWGIDRRSGLARHHGSGLSL